MAYGDDGPLSPGSQQGGSKKEILNPTICGGAASGYSVRGLRRPFGLVHRCFTDNWLQNCKMK